MQADVLDLHTALKGLILLSAIPIVLFALWSDYFMRGVEIARRDNPDFNASEESLKVRLAGALTLLMEAVVFLGTAELRDTFPILTYSFFIGSVAVIVMLQQSYENTIQPSAPPGSEQDPDRENIFHILGKLILSWALTLVAHLFFFFSSIIVGALIAHQLGVPPSIRAFFIICSGALGIFFSLGLNLALGPIQFRKTFPVSDLADPMIKVLCERAFIKSGLLAPRFQVIETRVLQIAYPIISGFQFFKGRFRQTVYFSRITLATLSGHELEAILLNQVSHICLRHMRNRMALSLGLVLFTALPTMGLIQLNHGDLHLTGGFSILGFVLLALSFLISFKALERQRRIQILEADLYCIRSLGAKMDVLISAIQKLDWLTTQTTDHVLQWSTQERIELIRRSLKNEQKTEDALATFKDAA